jgi:hypothetical protein
MSLIISHNAGFFSCCSVALNKIVLYINKNKTFPEKVDTSDCFTRYKPKITDDITYDFFELPNDSKFLFTNNIKYSYANNQEHRNKDFINIIPIIKKYFVPSLQIKTLSDKFKKNYNICYEKCIAVYYRGTDKIKEIKLDSFESFQNQLNKLLLIVENNDVQILLQSDSAQFLDYMTNNNKNKNIIIIKELAPSYTSKGTHFERTKEQNYIDIKNLFAIVLIMSKCKYIICNNGNVVQWMILYRGNGNNVHQNLNFKWVV